jgi:MOSC domain-containing protein YiiM
MLERSVEGRVAHLLVSRGGVPKRPVPEAAVGPEGLAGDWQRDRRHHGGPDRAVCLFSLEVIEALRAEGHPVEPGSTGENVTVEGLPWGEVTPGRRFTFDGGVVLEVVSYAAPCGTIRGSFADGRTSRIDQELHPGSSRVYARVVAGGTLKEGATVRLDGRGEAR